MAIMNFKFILLQFLGLFLILDYQSVKESEAVVQKTLSNQQKEVLQELESAAKTEETKEWNVSQDDIHFYVHMLDKHGQVYAVNVIYM